MHLSLITVLIGVAGVIALPGSKVDLDPRTAVDRKLEVREPQVSSCTIF